MSAATPSTNISERINNPSIFYFLPCNPSEPHGQYNAEAQMLQDLDMECLLVKFHSAMIQVVTYYTQGNKLLIGGNCCCECLELLVLLSQQEIIHVL